jgi:uncharacterized protein YbgA (DUF1722 family)/uncharacterized protein YbbK (DUF523 family)
MDEQTRPRVVVSKCLGFAPCRWNGVTLPNEFVERLGHHVDYIPVCPEVEIELGVPRDPVRIVLAGNELRLMQPATEIDHTDKMVNFCGKFLDSLHDVDGFILKSRSPSCGIKETKIYSSMRKGAAVKKGSGFFGAAVTDKFPMLPVEDDGRMLNFTIREHFLRRLFTIAGFRRIKETVRMNNIVRFQAENKFLLMAYNQKEFRLMGRIVANHEKKPPSEVYKEYQAHLYSALAKPVRYTSYINVLMHAMGHFSEKLNKDEKAFFLDLMDKYRKGKSPLASDLDVLIAWGVRFGEKYLLDQTFFKAYPQELLDISDSGKGRDY